jgi:glutathione synthase/RimK-type ligase-like ATP-grasp enzyme
MGGVAASVALVTCAEIPELEYDDRLVAAPLRARGIDCAPVVWDDPAADWDRYDLVVLRSPWDYAQRHDEFLAWAAGVPRLANAAEVVEWNTDKRYLAELSAAGVRAAATEWVLPASTWAPPAGGEWVVKPAVSAGSKDAGRYDMTDPDHREHAVAHVDRLRRAGRLVMVQPYLAAVDTHGETGLIFFDGAYSHAIRKGPMLEGPDFGVTGLYKPEEIVARQPTAAERALAELVMRAVPADLAPTLYARVDLIPGPDGDPVLVELELTEPSLFLDYAEGAADRFAAAIASRLSA